jgi:hypothetical protein
MRVCGEGKTWRGKWASGGDRCALKGHDGRLCGEEWRGGVRAGGQADDHVTRRVA